MSAGSLSSPYRPLLLRSGMPWTPERSACEPVAGSGSAGFGSPLTASPYSHPHRGVSGGYSRHAVGTYEARVRAEAVGATDDDAEYVFPQRV